MKITINAESSGDDSVKSLVDLLATQGIVAKPEEIIVSVWSEKGAKFIPFEAKNIKFTYTK